MAVVAMVEPEIAEKTVPATTATTASRPGTWRISRSMPSMTFEREPGVKQHLAHQHEQRDRRQREVDDRSHAVARDLREADVAAEKQHGADQVDRDERDRDRQPMNSSTVEPPSSSSDAICHDIMPTTPSRRRHGVVARRRARPAPGDACGRRIRSRAGQSRPASARAVHHSGVTSVLIETAPAA